MAYSVKNLVMVLAKGQHEFGEVGSGHPDVKLEVNEPTLDAFGFHLLRKPRPEAKYGITPIRKRIHRNKKK